MINDCKVYDLYPGYACNAKCVFCFNPAEIEQRKKGMSFQQVARELYGMRRMGHRHMNILGGEPTIRPDLPAICSLAKRLGYLTVAITTNGLRVSDPTRVRELAAAGLDLAILSVHGHTPELHDRIVGVPGALEKVFRAIANFQNAGVSVQVAVVAHRLNHAHLADFFRVFLGRGVVRFTVLYLRYHGHMDIPDGRKEDLKVPMREVARSVHDCSPLFWERGLRTPRLCHILPCVLAGYESRMDNLVTQEDAHFDGFYLDPDTKNPSSTWIDHKDKIKLPRCRGCVFFSECPGVEKAYVEVFGDAEFQPLPSRPAPFTGIRS